MPVRETTSPPEGYVEIGTTRGITTEALHDDVISLVSSELNNNISSPSDPPAETPVLLGGGSYKTGGGAGVWSSQMYDDKSFDSNEVGFRCVIPLREENYFEKQYGRNVPNFAAP